MQAAFFISPNALLGNHAPLDLLNRGDAEAVARATAAHGEQGAA
jgi:hypothetical protein